MSTNNPPSDFGVSKETQHSCLKMRVVGSGIRTRERLDRRRSIGDAIASRPEDGVGGVSLSLFEGDDGG